MNVAVGLAQRRSVFHITIEQEFKSASGDRFVPGRYTFSEPVALTPCNPDTPSFLVEDVTIGIGFHWQRNQRQAFRGGFRITRSEDGLTLINDVGLDAYVEGVIASEMSAMSPPELLKTHAVISRSWLVSQLAASGGAFRMERQVGPRQWEIISWYGKESHADFDVCADDHCQRYQGIPLTGYESARRAVTATAGEFIFFGGQICDARFSKCCGGVTEDYRSAWDDTLVPYLVPVHDAPTGNMPHVDSKWIRERPEAYCNTRDPDLLRRILPRFDQETTDFFRWQVRYTSAELAELVETRTGLDLGQDLRLEPLERGASGRIVRLAIEGSSGRLSVGKELEIRKTLSPSHLYSSAFVVDPTSDGVRLCGAGWGHGVGLCQIGAGVMAERGSGYREILGHYYAGAQVGRSGSSS